MLAFGSLFAGIGGLDLGLERAGMQCKWQVEIDDYATRVLAKHWPNVRRWRDIRTFPPDANGHQLRDKSGWSCWTSRADSAKPADNGELWVDLICGGFPCQDISYAGRGAGLEGERSGLFFEAIRVIRTLAPRYVLLENVQALVSGATRYRHMPDRCVCGWSDRWRRLYLAEQAQEQIRLHLRCEGRSWHGSQGDGAFAVACERIWRDDPQNAKRLGKMDGGSCLGAIWERGDSIFDSHLAASEAESGASEISSLRPAFSERWMDRRESSAWKDHLGISSGIECERATNIIRELLACPSCRRNLGDGAADTIRRSWFGTVQRELAQIGYDCEWHCIPAAAVGAPHIRDRVFVIAHPQEHGCGEGREGGAVGTGARKEDEAAVADTETEGLERARIFRRPTISSWWATEPDVGRVAHGIPARMDRLKCLGNAVVPQVAEWIGRRIVEFETAERQVQEPHRPA